MAEIITKLRTARLPVGFRAAGISSGIKENGAKDLGMVISDFPTASAATFIVSVSSSHSSHQPVGLEDLFLCVVFAAFASSSLSNG